MLVLYAVVVGLAYSILKCIYRFYLHPLAGIPGPKLAAITGWYEAYFELLHKGIGGQYTFHIMDLHKKYGPIIRINPNEVHIDDPEFFSTIYTYREGYDKPQHLKWRFGSPNALFSTPEHRVHRIRRAAQDPYFAKRRIAKYAPQIQGLADAMCEKLQMDFVNSGKPVTLDNLFASYIADVTTQYAFGKTYKWLDHPNFESPFVKAIRSFKDIAHPCTQFPWLARALAAIPEFVTSFLQPSMLCVIDFQHEMRRLIQDSKRELLEVRKTEKPGILDKTIIHGVLSSQLPEIELQDEILKDHAVSLLGAGIASAQWTLTIACFHIMSDARVYKRLRDELEAVMPTPHSRVPLQNLEELPFLAACVDEATRLACGQMTRSPRISEHPIEYGSYILPPGALISLDTWHMHHNETLYPSSYDFRPERWIGNPSAPAPYGNKPLKHYMVAFGKGTRHCIGMNLAQAEITIALASLIRNFDWEVWETTYEDVRVVRDLIAPDVSRKSNGVQAVVREYGVLDAQS